MAKAKSGGTRSYLRGRIANDVYSIGKDAKGKKQQVVRSLAESVANPQTLAQMRGRMIMSTVMQAVSGLAVFVDHSFDNVPNGQPSISEFIRRNYALVKASVTEHPTSGGDFFLNKYQEKGALPGAYVVAAGNAVLPTALSNIDADNGEVILPAMGENATAAAFRTALGLGDEDYFTLIGVTPQNGFVAARLHPSKTLADDTVITSANLLQLFDIEYVGNATIEVTTNGTGATAKFGLQVNDAEQATSYGRAIILSRKTATGYEHNDAQMTGAFSTIVTAQYSADAVLPTYPLGAERFLNGGEL